jgi:hypothetical protein
MIETYGASWMRASAESFYGRFGFMDVHLPQWVYRLIVLAFSLSITFTYGSLFFRWRTLPNSLRFMLLLAPCILGVSVLTSLDNSWVYDFQPQGRYLFSALAPLAVMLGGTVDFESSRMNRLRAGIWLLLWLVSMFLLWRFVLHNPVFR